MWFKKNGPRGVLGAFYGFMLVYFTNHTLSDIEQLVSNIRKHQYHQQILNALYLIYHKPICFT